MSLSNGFGSSLPIAFFLSKIHFIESIIQNLFESLIQRFQKVKKFEFLQIDITYLYLEIKFWVNHSREILPFMKYISNSGAKCRTPKTAIADSKIVASVKTKTIHKLDINSYSMHTYSKIERKQQKKKNTMETES